MGEGFSNPALGGGGALLRNSGHSIPYTPGVVGWTINQNGFAEFNNVVLRGSLLAKNGNSEVEITNTPGPLIRFNPEITTFSDGTIRAGQATNNRGQLELTSPANLTGPMSPSKLLLLGQDPVSGSQSRVQVDSQTQLGDILVSGTWTALFPFYNAGYSDLSAAAGFGFFVEYQKLCEGLIVLRGTMHKGTGAGGAGANGFAAGDIPMTLPVGLRPPQQMQYAGGCQARAANFGTYRMQISAAGNISFQTSAAHDPGWVSVDGLRIPLL